MEAEAEDIRTVIAHGFVGNAGPYDVDVNPYVEV